jgi:predicted AlkP superfamily phosphohydrolase/phosphomutase
MSAEKVLVIGVDGATFDVINPLIKDGRLPNIEKMMKNGSHGNLRSTIPPLSPVAWTSFMTGKNPGKHNIFDFVVRKTDSYNVVMNNAENRKAPPVWSVVSESGRKTCVVGVTLTYPPDKVSGYMVSGLGAPMDIESSDYTYPADLAKEIRENVGEYRIIYPIKLHKFNESDKIKKDYLDCVVNAFEFRLDLFRYLWKKDEYDFSMLFFLDTDGVSHHFWRYADPNHKLFEKNKNQDAINYIYESVDAVIGKILSLVGDDVNIIVISDHGFGPLNRILHLNKWLETKGYLKFRNVSLMKRVANKLKRRKENAIEWNSTKAYFIGTSGNVNINLKGREPSGIVEPSEYESLRNENGEKIVNQAYLKEEIYSGDYLENAPDIIITFNPGYDILGEEPEQAKQHKTDEIITDCRRWSGKHEQEGILIACGNVFNKGCRVEGSEIVDIIPTILYMLGISIPEGMDGKVLEGILDEGFLKSNPVKYREGSGAEDTKTADMDKKDMDKLTDMLRNLGYLE